MQRYRTLYVMPSKGPDSNSCTLHLKVPNLNVVDRLAERPNIALNFQMVMLSMLVCCFYLGLWSSELPTLLVWQIFLGYLPPLQDCLFDNLSTLQVMTKRINPVLSLSLVIFRPPRRSQGFLLGTVVLDRVGSLSVACSSHSAFGVWVCP